MSRLTRRQKDAPGESDEKKGSSMSEEKGTGKHPHKSTEQPRPHQEGPSEKKGAESHKGESHKNESESRHSSASGESGDLKEREYRDSKGEIHHHTRTYQEQHGEGSRESESGGGSKTRAAGSSKEGGSEDLAEREYRDEKGGVHHHTRTSGSERK